MIATRTTVEIHHRQRTPVCLLPGPVQVHPWVRAAFAEPPVSHRSAGFEAEFRGLREALCRLVGMPVVQLLLGSGTLANDAVAAQLTLARGRGVICTNGEFGERLVDHAGRFGLEFSVVASVWGEALRYDELERAARGCAWVWAVHCETSTGVLNDLEALSQIAGRTGARLCLDGISAIGTLPVTLARVELATCVSGKALASYPGLSMVFSQRAFSPARSLPRYLDLGTYADNGGVPFTTSSNLVRALARSVERLEQIGLGAIAAERGALVGWLRAQLERLGYRVLVPAGIASPALFTLVLPPATNSRELGTWLERRGYFLHYRSGYLSRRNWMQVCLMGEHTREELEPLLELLACRSDGSDGSDGYEAERHA